MRARAHTRTHTHTHVRVRKQADGLSHIGEVGRAANAEFEAARQRLSDAMKKRRQLATGVQRIQSDVQQVQQEKEVGCVCVCVCDPEQ